MSSQHIVKSYDNELKTLSNMIVELSQKVRARLISSIQAAKANDKDLAAKIRAEDHIIDKLEKDIDNYGVRILALRHPVAQDLRHVVAALKISSDLERVGDYASNISKRVKKLTDKVTGEDAKVIDQLLNYTVEMLDETISAYQNEDKDLAVKSWYKDQKVDDDYLQFLRKKLEDNQPTSTEQTLQLIFIAKHIERSADHITNIAEMIYYIHTGENFQPEES